MTVSPVSGPERRSVLNGKHQVLETDTGEVLERRDDPEAPFFADLDARESERPRFTRHRRARKSLPAEAAPSKHRRRVPM